MYVKINCLVRWGVEVDCRILPLQEWKKLQYQFKSKAFQQSEFQLGMRKKTIKSEFPRKCACPWQLSMGVRTHV